MVTSENAGSVEARTGLAFFSLGFRPFFLGAAVFAGVALPAWVAVMAFGLELPFEVTLAWHVHEMLFGYLGAVLAGFLLTAIPNWTGRAALSGPPLAALFALWIAGRIAMALSTEIGVAAGVVDAIFLIAVAAVAWREVIAGGNKRNYPICVLVSLVALANIGLHAGSFTDLETGTPIRAALAVFAFLIAVVGGRITPNFTRNWLAQQGRAASPVDNRAVNVVALGLTAAGLAAWCVDAGSPVAGGLLIAAALALAVRLAGWRGYLTTGEPLMLVLHIAYLWLPVSFLLMGLAIVAPEVIGRSAALHALTAGAIGLMPLAVMTRASLGHAGRPLAAGPATVLSYILVGGGGVLRTVADWLPFDTATTVGVSGLLWAGGFLVFALAYGPLLCRR